MKLDKWILGSALVILASVASLWVSAAPIMPYSHVLLTSAVSAGFVISAYLTFQIVKGIAMGIKEGIWPQSPGFFKISSHPPQHKAIKTKILSIPASRHYAIIEKKQVEKKQGVQEIIQNFEKRSEQFAHNHQFKASKTSVNNQTNASLKAPQLHSTIEEERKKRRELAYQAIERRLKLKKANALKGAPPNKPSEVQKKNNNTPPASIATPVLLASAPQLYSDSTNVILPRLTASTGSLQIKNKLAQKRAHAQITKSVDDMFIENNKPELKNFTPVIENKNKVVPEEESLSTEKFFAPLEDDKAGRCFPKSPYAHFNNNVDSSGYLSTSDQLFSPQFNVEEEALKSEQVGTRKQAVVNTTFAPLNASSLDSDELKTKYPHAEKLLAPAQSPKVVVSAISKPFSIEDGSFLPVTPYFKESLSPSSQLLDKLEEGAREQTFNLDDLLTPFSLEEYGDKMLKNAPTPSNGNQEPEINNHKSPYNEDMEARRSPPSRVESPDLDDQILTTPRQITSTPLHDKGKRKKVAKSRLSLIKEENQEVRRSPRHVGAVKRILEREKLLKK